MQFYQLTLPEVINLYQEGKITTFCALEFYIKIKFAPGWKIVIDRDEVLKIFGLTIHQFRRAVNKLKDKLTIFVKSIKEIAKASVKKDTLSVSNNNLTATKVTPSVNYDPQTTNKINASEDSPDIRSNINHISLSDSGATVNAHQDKPKPKQETVALLPAEEREKFLDFAMDRVNQLPKRPSLPSKWIAANFDDLYSEFKLSSAPETQKATNEAEFQEWSDLMKAIGKITRKYQHKGKWVLIDVCGREIEYEDYRQSYTLEYLRKLVGGK